MTNQETAASNDAKLYVRLNGADMEFSTLSALNAVLKASGLGPRAQERVLGYLLDRVHPAAEQPGE